MKRDKTETKDIAYLLSDGTKILVKGGQNLYMIYALTQISVNI